MPEMEPLQGERSVFYTRMCRKKNGLVLTKPSVLSPGEWHLPAFPRPTLSAEVQNLPSKQVAPTDNMRPNLDDNYI